MMSVCLLAPPPQVVKVISIMFKHNKDKHDTEELQPSAVGKRLNELIIQKVIITVGVITLLAPFLSLSEIDGSAASVGLEMLVLGQTAGAVGLDGGNYSMMVTDYQQRMFNQSGFELVFLEVEGMRFLPTPGTGWDECAKDDTDPSAGCPPEITDIRFDYLSLLSYNASRAWFDVSAVEKTGAIWRIILTLFMAILLSLIHI